MTVEKETIHMVDGKWVPTRRFTHHECCDCGLVHRVKYKEVDGVLYEQWIRAPKLTAAARKRITNK